MPINLISKIKPYNNGQFPIAEDIDIEGGYQVRTNLTDRDSIPTNNRKIGMLVFVQSNSTYYTLTSGITNSDWIIASFNLVGSAGGDLSSTYPNPTVSKIQNRAISSTSPVDGYVLTWVASNNDWEPKAVTGGDGYSLLTVQNVSISTSVDIVSNKLVNISHSNSVTITLMGTHTVGTIMYFKDAAGVATSFNIEIFDEDFDIDINASAFITTNFGSVTIVFVGNQWVKV